MKTPHATSYTEDARSVQLLDIAPTVVAHFGGRTTPYAGAPIPQVDRQRDIAFYAYSRAFDGKLSKYRLTAGGWRFVEDVPLQP